MKPLLTAVSISLLCSQMALAADLASASASAGKVGYVNINQAFNDSKYVQEANKKLQSNVQTMEKQVKEQQLKLQKLAQQYDQLKTPDAAKTKLQNQIIEEQKKLTQMTQTFQNKIREEQSSGMQEFSKKVQAAAAQVAKEKQLSAVISSAALVYTDGSWVDITKDVEAKI